MQVNAASRTFSIHRLLAETFIPNPNSYPQVNHKNGDKADNSLKNLEWCTAKQNHAHARRMGLIKGSDLFKPVIAYNKDETRVFPSLTHASLATGALKTNIAKCCRGRRAKAAGYSWKYATPNPLTDSFLIAP